MHTLIALGLALASVQAPTVTTQFVTSKDGTKIAYDVTGSGPVVILLHGGGQERKSWHRAGYVARLAKEFTVVTLDMRGNGESDQPVPVAAYAWDRMNEDDIFMSYIKKMPSVPVWITALIGYPPVEPSDMRCPTLWVVGTNNEGAYNSARQYQGRLSDTKVTLEIFEGLNHPQEFEVIDRVYPRERDFTRTHAR
jgi:hypothetical protein